MGYKKATYDLKKQRVLEDVRACGELISVPTKLAHLVALWGAERSVNEVFLLHGTKPENVLKVLHNGLNERFSGGLFGKGVYLAEDPSKIDQYCTPDMERAAEGSELALLHNRLYPSSSRHPAEVFYGFVVRTMLGMPIFTQDGQNNMFPPGQAIFATSDQRELATVPATQPPVHYHSLIAEKGQVVKRHREFIIFDGDDRAGVSRRIQASM